MKKPEKKGLGRGLSALLADTDMDPQGGSSHTPGRNGETLVPIHRLYPNPDQPRRDFSENALSELTASIAEKGVIQPLIVRHDPMHKDGYQIVAGERRWRAAQRAKLHELPVLIRQLSDTEVLELAIIENIQRADLNAIEEAMGYRQLMDRFGHTQEQMAEALGKSRSHIANLMRLLGLPQQVLSHVREGRLSAGHARALVTAADPVALAHQVISRGLSVRQTEQLAKEKSEKPILKQRLMPKKDADTRALESDLAAHLRLQVSINHRPDSEVGELRIHYTSLDELDGLCQLLSR